MSQLATALIGKHGGPILVCGGAPCLPGDLDKLHRGGFDLGNAVIISGNEHAVHAGMAPDYIAVNDDVHTVLGVHQEPRMRAMAPYAKLLSRHWWADYRHPKMIKANSGITGIVWAMLMGANPIITAGFELYRGKQCYFHNKVSFTSPSMNRPDMFMHRQVEELKRVLQHVPLRAVSGPLAKAFALWRPDEQFTPRGPTELEARLAALQPRKVYAATTTVWDGAVVPKGATFAVLPGESKDAVRFQGFLDVTDKEPTAAAAEEVAAVRARHLRHMELVARARGNPRGVRRGLYDADLVRIAEWTEGGDSPAAIAQRTGLPKEQVLHLVKAMGVGNEQAG